MCTEWTDPEFAPVTKEIEAYKAVRVDDLRVDDWTGRAYQSWYPLGVRCSQEEHDLFQRDGQILWRDFSDVGTIRIYREGGEYESEYPGFYLWSTSREIHDFLELMGRRSAHQHLINRTAILRITIPKGSMVRRGIKHGWVSINAFVIRVVEVIWMAPEVEGRWMNLRETPQVRAGRALVSI